MRSKKDEIWLCKARVRTINQKLANQNELLKLAGAEKIFQEKFTGTTTERPEFQKLLRVLKTGDTLIVTKLDRFVRNTREAVAMIQELGKLQVSGLVRIKFVICHIKIEITIAPKVISSMPTGKSFNLMKTANRIIKRLITLLIELKVGMLVQMLTNSTKIKKIVTNNK